MNTDIEKEKVVPSRKKKVRGAPKLYEAMLLVDSAEAATDLDGVIKTIKNILEKDGAEIVSIRKWDERKLAYTISGKSKGTYILCYFKAEGSKLQNIERDIQLSERIIRALILCAEQRDTGDIEASLVSRTAGASEPQKQAGEVEEAKVEEQKQPEVEGLEQAD